MHTPTCRVEEVEEGGEEERKKNYAKGCSMLLAHSFFYQEEMLRGSRSWLRFLSGAWVRNTDCPATQDGSSLNSSLSSSMRSFDRLS